MRVDFTSDFRSLRVDFGLLGFDFFAFLSFFFVIGSQFKDLGVKVMPL